MEKVTFTRTELYDLVWKSTFGFITKKYGISGFGIRKACEQLQIPLPDNSHWISIKYDRHLHITKLPENYTGNDTIDIVKKAFEVNNNINELSPLIRLTKEIQNDTKAPLVVPDILIKPEQLTLQTKQFWDRRAKDKNYILDKSVDVLFFKVSKELKQRALIFMDSLIKLLKYRGHNVQIGRYDIEAVVDGIEIQLYLREALKRIPGTKLYESSTYIYTGELILQIGQYSSKKEWRDNKSALLEDILARIVAKLELYAKEKKEWEERCRLNRIKQEKEAEIIKIYQERRQKELSDFKQLLSKAERLDKTAKLRHYIKTVEENALADNSLDEELKNWIVWAKDKVDWYDPLISKEDDFLNDYDFKNLV
jgi:hypothetical protein